MGIHKSQIEKINNTMIVFKVNPNEDFTLNRLCVLVRAEMHIMRQIVAILEETRYIERNRINKDRLVKWRLAQAV